MEVLAGSLRGESRFKEEGSEVVFSITARVLLQARARVFLRSHSIHRLVIESRVDRLAQPATTEEGKNDGQAQPANYGASE